MGEPIELGEDERARVLAMAKAVVESIKNDEDQPVVDIDLLCIELVRVSEAHDRMSNCFLCIECGIGAADDEGCCTTCGRDTLMFENGKIVNRDFADNLESDIQSLARREAFIQGYVDALDPKTPAATLEILPKAEGRYVEWRTRRK